MREALTYQCDQPHVTRRVPGCMPMRRMGTIISGGSYC